MNLRFQLQNIKYNQLNNPRGMISAVFINSVDRGIAFVWETDSRQAVLNPICPLYKRFSIDQKVVIHETGLPNIIQAFILSITTIKPYIPLFNFKYPYLATSDFVWFIS